MTYQPFEYFYDSQQVRFLEQIIRAFSGWAYLPGSVAGLTPTPQIVPCMMGQTNQTVANILRNQSTNTILATPMITVFQTGLKGRMEDLQNRNHVDRIQVVERAIDPETNAYTSERGQSYTVERLMPLPFNMEIQIDLWTSNLDQKYQLVEQILTTMWPNFDIQNSQNGLDWSALTTVYFEDINLSSKSYPVGASDDIDVTTFNLRLPIWLTPPAKVKQQRVIQQIITNISDTTPFPNSKVILDHDAGNLQQNIVTPGDHHIQITGNQIKLLGPHGREVRQNEEPYTWKHLIERYGVLRPAVSMVAIKTSNDSNSLQIAGTIQASEDPSILNWQIDPASLPANTLPAVDAVIDPLKNFPVGGGLPDPIEGARYLILADIGPSVAWGTINAKYGDIIQYTGGSWTVSFNSVGSTQQYVLNRNKGNQLRWTGDDWVMAIDGTYLPGAWRLWL